MATGSAASKSRSNNASKKSNQNYSTSLAKGGSVTVRNGVKTYSDKSLNVTGNNGISISGKDYSRNKGGTGFAPTDSINASALAPSTPLKIPTKDPVTGVPDIAAVNQGLANPATGVTTDPSGKLTVTPPQAPGAASNDKYAGLVQMFDTYQKGVQNIAPPNTEDIYNKQYKADKIAQKQQAVNDYTAQLNTIVASRDANVLKLEGQGRGITDVIIGGQQAQVNKEAAIQALPVQAQLAAAQGNLELAQNHLDTMFKIKSQDAVNQYNYKTKLLDSVYGFVTGIAQNKVADLKAAEERKYQENQDFIKTQQSALSNALAQGAPTAIYNAIKSATSKNDVILAAGIYNGDVLARQIQQAQLRKLNEPSGGGGNAAPTVKSINGVDMQWNGSSWEPIGTGTSGALTPKQEQAQMILRLARDLRSNSTAGKSGAIGFGFQKFLPFGVTAGLQPDRAGYIAKLETLKSNLTLDNLSLLKGAMSDKDLQFIQSAGSSLSENMSQKSFNTELDRIISKFSGVVPTQIQPTAPLIRGIDPRLLTGNIVTTPDGLQVEIVD